MSIISQTEKKVRLKINGDAIPDEWNLPTLYCQTTPDRIGVRFRCGICNRYHLHSNDPRRSPDKGHRFSHCRQGVYPRGYYLRTDLDRIYSERYPNLAVILSGPKAFNAHYHQCKRLGLPMVSIRKVRNYAMVDIDFVTVNYRMDSILSLMIDKIGVDYRKLRQPDVRGKRRSLGYINIFPRESRETAMFWIFVNDAYPVAAVVMPLINDRAHWVSVGAGR